MKLKLHRRREKRKSISFYIRLIMLAAIVPMILIILLVNLQSRHTLKQQVLKINSDMLGLYMAQIDGTLRDVDYYLNLTVATDQDILELQVASDELTRSLAKYSLFNKLANSTLNYTKIGGFFAYACTPGAEDGAFVGVNAQKNTTTETQMDVARIRTAFSNGFQNDSLNLKRWFWWQLDGEYYLVRIIYDRNTYLGCWVNLNDLMIPLETVDLGKNGYAMITSSEGQCLTKQEEKERTSYLRASKESKIADIVLVAMISDENLLKDYNTVIRVLSLFSLVIILIIPLSGIGVQRFISRPLTEMILTMKKIKDGASNERADINGMFMEFYSLSITFNEMVDEIQKLKIDVYEHKLKEKETYLQYLQLQIQPHFFLNCMSLMHSLAELQKYKVIQQLSTSLVKYFRYMFHKATTLISVEEEIEHVKNYMDIQNIRFPDKIVCDIEVEEGTENILLPPLAIQTFVENSMKYGVDLQKNNRIEVRVCRRDKRLNVTIRDNGPGYPVDVLMVLNSVLVSFEDGQTDRIGIFNVKERLKLLYGSNSYIHFYNQDGSVTEFVIPVGEGDTE